MSGKKNPSAYDLRKMREAKKNRKNQMKSLAIKWIESHVKKSKRRDRAVRFLERNGALHSHCVCVTEAISVALWEADGARGGLVGSNRDRADIAEWIKEELATKVRKTFKAVDAGFTATAKWYGYKPRHGGNHYVFTIKQGKRVVVKDVTAFVKADMSDMLQAHVQRALKAVR